MSVEFDNPTQIAAAPTTTGFRSVYVRAVEAVRPRAAVVEDLAVDPPFIGQPAQPADHRITVAYEHHDRSETRVTFLASEAEEIADLLIVAKAANKAVAYSPWVLARAGLPTTGTVT